MRRSIVRRSACLLGGILLAWAALSGQSYLIRTYAEGDGLASSRVNDLTQTSDGRIWFATRAGLSVYDGSTWTTYSVPHLLRSRTVDRLALDGEGGLWAWGNSPYALARWRGDRWESFPADFTDRGASYPSGLAIAGRPGREAVYLSTYFAGIRLRRDGRWTWIRKADGLASDEVRGLAVIDDAVYAATASGLTILREGVPDNEPQRNHPLLRQGLTGIAAERTPAGARLWLAGKDWLGRLTGAGLEILATNLVMMSDRIYPGQSIAPDGAGGVYFGNPYALHRWRASDRKIESLDKDSGLIADGASSILLDREKNVWVAGLRGVSKISGRRFANFRKIQGLLEDEVTALAKLPDGRVVFGHNMGLSFYDGRRFRTLVFPRRGGAQPTSSRVLDLYAAPSGVVWAAAAQAGLARIAPDGSIRWYGAEAGLEGSVSGIAPAEGGGLWLASDSGLLRFDGVRAVRVPVPLLEGTSLRRIGRAADGRIFATSVSRGVYVRTKKGWTQIQSPDDANANNVFAMAEDARGALLAGTLAGLFEVREGRLSPYRPPGLTIERPVYLILRAPGGVLWFGTDNGAVRWDGRTSQSYTTKQGFAGAEVNRAAGLVDADGRVWLGTNTGVSRYHAESDFAADAVPPPLVAIDRIEAGGTAWPPDRPLHLGARQNTLEFSARVVTFIDESAIRSRYRLDGFDKAWSEPRPAGGGVIRYTNLPPGSYVLRLQAENALGGWSDPVSSAEISIRAPLTRRWWFYLMAALAAFGLSVAGYQLAAGKRTAAALERQVRDRTAEIRASLDEKNVLLSEIHHRVKNNLQIVASLLSMQSRKARDPESLALFRESMDRVRAMALIHETLYRSESAAAVAAPDYVRRLARELLAAYAVRAGNIGLALDLEDVALTLEAAFPCGLIISELVSNALKHAFPDGRPGTIRIGLRKEGDEAVLSVADDGRGLPAGLDAAAAASLGLRLVRNLCGQLEGTLTVESGPGGSRFAVRFPLRGA